MSTLDSLMIIKLFSSLLLLPTARKDGEITYEQFTNVRLFLANKVLQFKNTKTKQLSSVVSGC